jgi:CRISPR-associated protein Cas5t
MSANPRTRLVLKVEIEGDITSFRYPHFTQGYQPTYDMPPPSTIYGLVCSAVGKLIDPANFEFGYHFEHSGKFVDYKEHLHYLDPIQPNPLDRELLFKPRLTLYLSDSSLPRAFRRPYHSLTLGRSQDLVQVTSLKEIELIETAQGVFAHTLLPLDFAPTLAVHTVAATMPRYIDKRRHVNWGVYAMLTSSAVYPSPSPDKDAALSEELALDMSSLYPQKLWWADETVRTRQGQPRLVFWHSLIG